MGQFRSFGRLSFLLAVISLIQPLIHGYTIPRSTNITVMSTSTINNDNKTTSTLADISGNATLTRDHFDTTVAQWKADNPHLAKGLAADAIETVWNHLSGNATTRRKKRSTPQHKAPLHKRQNATQSDIEAARKLTAAAAAEAGVSNTYIRANPRRNKYTTRPANDTSSKIGRRDGISSTIVNSTIASAAALVAEADAALLAANGSLNKDYTFTGKYAKYNQPGFPTGSKLKKRDTYFWLEDLASQYPGTYPYGDDGYVVYRNVKDYGAVGDGVTDDTAAINSAISDGNRCGSGCGSSSVKNALIYFPSGIYLVSTPIISLYGSQLVGNINDYPTILAAPSFVGLGVISSDVYLASGEYYIDTNNFFRQVRNFIIDMTKCTTASVAGIHWQVAQATSIQNVLITMTEGSSSTQVGIFSENGSGGWMSDLIFYGGNIGIECGNQQFTTRNLAFLSETYAIYMLWDWGWTWKSLEVIDCTFGIYFDSTDVGGSIYVLDSIFSSVTIAIAINTPSGSTIEEQILISIDNMVLEDVSDAIVDVYPSTVILAGGSTTIESWVIGKVYDAANPSGTWFGGKALDVTHPTTGQLAGGPQGGYYERSRPAYADSTEDYWLSAQLLATGDGSTDDTAALSFMFLIGASYGYGIFVPTGSYIIATPPLLIPINAVIAGACWTQFVASGDSYNDMDNPVSMIQIGNEGDLGNVEIQDVLFTVKGATQGAVLVEWNAYQGAQGSVGMWDCHFRIGGALGSELQAANCPITSDSDSCIAASMGLHVTSGASGYFENVWVWTADHDMDSGVAQTQINIFSGRGILVESQGPCWFYGTASEHAVLYQYNIAGAANIYMGMIQTESPYYPPFVIAPAPFTSSLNKFSFDPDFSDCNGAFPCAGAWALTITNSDNIQVTGAGLYSWFQDYNEACVDTQNCQQRLTATTDNGAIYLFNVYTIGSIGMIHDFIETFGTESSSTLSLALAADNTVENAHPFLSALVSWVEIFSGWGTGDETGTGSSGDTGVCVLPDPGSIAVATASSDRRIAATLDYFLETTESGTTKFWANHLWSVDGSTQDCETPDSNNCGTAATCSKMTSTSNFWIENSVSNWNEYMTIFYNAFNTASFNGSLSVAAIVKAFPIQTGALQGSSAFLNNFAASLSLLGGVFGVMEDPALSVLTSTIGGVLAQVGGSLADAEAEDDLAAEALMYARIQNVQTEVLSSITGGMTNLITNGDLSSWPSNIFTGTYASKDRIAAYFDNGNFFYSPSDAIVGFDVTTLSKNLSIQYDKTLAGLALNAANWYILRNAYDSDACTSISTGTIMENDNGYCYTLEAPGGGLPATDTSSSHTTYSVPMDDDTLQALNGFGVALTDLYTSSWNCQKNSNAYDHIGDFSFNNLDFTLSIPDCFYNLPVISVVPATEEDSIWINTPCQVLINNNTASTQAVGTTFLPDNLWSVFDGSDFCCTWENHGVAFCAKNVSED